ncbi:MAG: metalloregulator ArsR/SmtB family transcription factor [Maricaulaceae bacterium]|jgi:DNA-binding transcriptional ArsR family regulator
MKSDEMRPGEMQRVADEVSDLLKMVANPNRLMALCELAEGECSVGRLAEKVGVRDQAMSQQLSILRAKGVVEARRDGQTIFYSLARDDVRRIIETLYDVFCADKKGRAGRRAPRRS